MSDYKPQVEVVIVGGGLVGMATALALAEQDIHSVIIEAKVPDLNFSHSSFDSRTLVVNPASRAFWQQLGIWRTIENSVTAINQVHVSNKGHFGTVLFDKNEFQVDALGHVVEATVLGSVLWERVKQSPNVSMIAPAELVGFLVNDSSITINYTTQGKQKTLNAQLMIAADGAQSPIRTQLKLPTVTKSYERSAIICNVYTEQSHQNRAYERLTNTGPFALLPFHNRMGLVWSLKSQHAEKLVSMSENQFIQAAQQEFGYRMGRITQVSQRIHYPLYKVQVKKQYQQRIVLMGNAAHTVSPVSAQGLNLAVRGINRLCKTLTENKKQGIDLGLESVLCAYQHASHEDQQRTLNYTDDLMTWFKIDEPVVNTLRSAGLVAINSSLSLKKALYKTAGGLR